MALLNINYKSTILNTTTGLSVILPEHRKPNVALPVLYLLHGYTGNHTSWQSGTSIERYVRYKNLAVVMPDAFNSFYTDMALGVYPYYTYFLNELMPFCTESFNLSPHRADTYIAGLSMGGYGAFKLALSNSCRFCAAASFSGALDMARLVQERDMRAVFGDIFEPQNDLFHLAKNVEGEKPRLYQWCGTEDYLYADNIKFRDYIKPLGFDYTYKDSKGDHEWKYWDEQIRKVLGWFGIRNELGEE